MTMEIKEQNQGLTESLKELYLNEDLQGLAQAVGHTIVVGNYVCDRDHDAIATTDEGGAYKGLKNPLDWDIFQNANAHADAIVTGTDYLERVKTMGLGEAQNVLNQYSKDGQYAEIGDWREAHGLNRNPDIIVLSRSLDVYVPPGIMDQGRKMIIFTTHASANSEKATQLLRDNPGLIIVDAGTADDKGVDGGKMHKYLDEARSDETGEKLYNVVKIVTGPRALKVFMDAGKLDVLYVTRVNKNIPVEPEKMVTIIADGGTLAERKDLEKIRSIKAEGVTFNDGSINDENFETYIKANLNQGEKDEFLKRIKNL